MRHTASQNEYSEKEDSLSIVTMEDVLSVDSKSLFHRLTPENRMDSFTYRFPDETVAPSNTLLKAKVYPQQVEAFAKKFSLREKEIRNRLRENLMHTFQTHKDKILRQAASESDNTFLLPYIIDAYGEYVQETNSSMQEIYDALQKIYPMMSDCAGLGLMQNDDGTLSGEVLNKQACTDLFFLLDINGFGIEFSARSILSLGPIPFKTGPRTVNLECIAMLCLPFTQYALQQGDALMNLAVSVLPPSVPWSKKPVYIRISTTLDAGGRSSATKSNVIYINPKSMARSAGVLREHKTIGALSETDFQNLTKRLQLSMIVHEIAHCQTNNLTNFSMRAGAQPLIHATWDRVGYSELLSFLMQFELAETHAEYFCYLIALLSDDPSYRIAKHYILKAYIDKVLEAGKHFLIDKHTTASAMLDDHFLRGDFDPLLMKAVICDAWLYLEQDLNNKFTIT